MNPINPEFVASLEAENKKLREEAENWLWCYSVVISVLEGRPGWETAKEVSPWGGALEGVTLAKKLRREVEAAKQAL